MKVELQADIKKKTVNAAPQIMNPFLTFSNTSSAKYLNLTRYNCLAAPVLKGACLWEEKE